MPFKREQDQLGIAGEQLLVEGSVTHHIEVPDGTLRVSVFDEHRKETVTLTLPESAASSAPLHGRCVFLNLRRHGRALNGGTRRRSFAVDENRKLAAALWAVFHDEIASGERVFFCFSQETLRGELAVVGLGAETPLVAVCAAARSCFHVEGDDVSLRPEALVPGATGISLAIVLVCQQVLAVEEMTRDGRAFSENAYFTETEISNGIGIASAVGESIQVR